MLFRFWENLCHGSLGFHLDARRHAKRPRPDKILGGWSRHDMKTTFPRIAIVVLLMVELAWVLSPHYGSLPMGETYRHQQRMEALTELSDNPSPATRASFQKELELLDKYCAYRGGVILALVLVLDGVLVVCFWNFGRRRVSVSESRAGHCD